MCGRFYRAEILYVFAIFRAVDFDSFTVPFRTDSDYPLGQDDAPPTRNYCVKARIPNTEEFFYEDTDERALDGCAAKAGNCFNS